MVALASTLLSWSASGVTQVCTVWTLRELFLELKTWLSPYPAPPCPNPSCFTGLRELLFSVHCIGLDFACVLYPQLGRELPKAEALFHSAW